MFCRKLFIHEILKCCIVFFLPKIFISFIDLNRYSFSLGLFLVLLNFSLIQHSLKKIISYLVINSIKSTFYNLSVKLPQILKEMNNKHQHSYYYLPLLGWASISVSRPSMMKRICEIILMLTWQNDKLKILLKI